MNWSTLADYVGDLDKRTHRFVACAVRKDGTAVYARNAAATHPMPSGHAEARVLRKAGKGAILYVVRVSKNGAIRPARPCARCLALIRSKKVFRVIYSISDSEYGVIQVK